MKAIAIWLVVAGTLIAGETLTGKVVSVSDGDTVRIYITGDRTTTKVRLDSIDAPDKGQPFSAVATRLLTRLAKGKECTVRQRGKDKYGRVLGIVTIDGKMLNVEMVKAGLAWHFVEYSKSKTLAKFEKEARDKKLGLWMA